MIDYMDIVTKYRGIINNHDQNEFDELLHELVASELTSGEIKKGLLLKASIEANGNEIKAKVIYAKMRVEQLKKYILQTAIEYDEKLRDANKKVEEIKRAAIDKYNADHKVCQNCNCITGKSILICPRCHYPF